AVVVDSASIPIPASTPETTLRFMMIPPCQPASHPAWRGQTLFASFQRLLQQPRSRQNGYLLSRGKRGELIRQRIEEESGQDTDVCSGRQATRRELTLQVLESVFQSSEGIRDVRYRARP